MSATVSEIIVFVLLVHTDRMFTAAYILACSYSPAQGARNVDAQFSVRDIDFSLCTHYIYCSAQLDTEEESIVPADPATEDGFSGTYKLFNDGKKPYPKVKTILSVGGATSQHDMAFRKLYSKDNTFRTFATNALTFIRDKGFDGLNIHWYTNDEESIRLSFPKLLTALNTAFENDYAGSALLLTMTGFAFPNPSNRYYDMIVIQKTVDYIFMPMSLLARDINAEFIDPLYSNFNNPNLHPALSVNASVVSLYRMGIPRWYMVVGVTALGHYAKLMNKFNFEPGAPIDEHPLSGPKYEILKRLAYPEICEMMPTARRYYDDVQKAPYLVTETTWVGYTDTVSLMEKINFVKSNNISGMEFSLLDQDDFSGKACQSGKFPLLSFLKKELNPDPPTTVAPRTTVRYTTRRATQAPRTIRPMTQVPHTNTPSTTSKPNIPIETDDQPMLVTYLILVLMFVVGFVLGFLLMRFARTKQRPLGEGE
ncbi:hypothetical protein BsWGS_24743 [Bradybaena similaris]